MYNVLKSIVLLSNNDNKTFS